MSILEKLGQFFDNLAIPTEIMEIFEGISGIWDAIPYALRATLFMIFGVACLLAIVKMLF